MKKSLIIISLFAATSFGWIACTPADNGAKEMAAIDSMANIKIMAMRDSMKMECSSTIDSIAFAKADSMIDAASHKGGSTKPSPKTTSPKVDINKNDLHIVNPKPTDPKTNKMNGGTSTSTENKTNKMNGTGSQPSTDKKTDKMNKPK